MRSITEWKKWLSASLGKYEVDDNDVLRWIERKDIPMLNYILYRGTKSQIREVLKLANFRNILLRSDKLKKLASNKDRRIASGARENLQRRGELS